MFSIATLQLHPYTAPGHPVAAPGSWEAFVSITWNYKDYNITTRKRNDRLKRRYRQLQIEQENTAIVYDALMEETVVYFKHKQDAVNLYFSGI